MVSIGKEWCGGNSWHRGIYICTEQCGPKLPANIDLEIKFYQVQTQLTSHKSFHVCNEWAGGSVLYKNSWCGIQTMCITRLWMVGHLKLLLHVPHCCILYFIVFHSL